MSTTNFLAGTTIASTWLNDVDAVVWDVFNGATTVAAATARLNSFVGDSGSGGTKGMVPAPSAGDSGKYLKGDGTWSSNVATLGANTFTGLQTFAAGADIASAATVDLGTATGNSVDVTHSTGTTAITSLGGASLQAGAEIETRFVISGGTLTLTHHATNLYLAGGANITLANGDVIRWRKMHSSNAEWKMVGGVKADGTAWVGSNSFSVIDAAGDLIVGTSDNTAGRLAIGTGLQQLRVNADATALEWATIASSGGLLAVTTFTGNGTWNKSTNNPSKIVAMAVGGGGAGGGADFISGGGISRGDGGCSGAVNWAYTAAPAASYAITIGAGGAGVSGSAGNNGGSTTVGALLTALGGRGGTILTCDGLSGPVSGAGEQGHSGLGQGGVGGTPSGNGSAASANTGAGGGGAITTTGSTFAGGAGGSGLVIIWEFA